MNLRNYFDKMNQLKNMVIFLVSERILVYNKDYSIEEKRKKRRLDCMSKIQNIIIENIGKGFGVWMLLLG